ncbi:SIS domain-containing protein [Galactobacillus timonensis]|uniref:SIS domain-containing protein n=1 Tax=Galactobacillus timonensis TaxID=2041840 RepID=UPI001436B9A0|nr:SIS domain-containing protein [Galactobacillus timonensis]
MGTIEENVRETSVYLDKILAGRKELFREAVKKPYTHIIITGSGSSYFASLSAADYMQKYMQIPVTALYPYQLEEMIPADPAGTLLIGVSQSGTSLSTARVMEEGKKKGCLTASMSGVDDSGTIINKYADYILTVNCGEEADLQSKTKGVICTTANLMLFALEWAAAHEKVSKAEYENAVNAYKDTVENMHVIIDDAAQWIEVHGSVFANSQDIKLVGTPNLAGVVGEGSLKLSETLRCPVFGGVFEEFIHGYYNAVNTGTLLVLIDDGTEKKMPVFADVLSEYAGNVVVEGADVTGALDFKVRTKGHRDYEMFEYMLWIYMICYRVACMKGVDISQPLDPLFHAKLGSKILRS